MAVLKIMSTKIYFHNFSRIKIPQLTTQNISSELSNKSVWLAHNKAFHFATQLVQKWQKHGEQRVNANAGRILIDAEPAARSCRGQTAAHNNNPPNQPSGQSCFTFSLPLAKHAVGAALGPRRGPPVPGRGPHRLTGGERVGPGPRRRPTTLCAFNK
jgi:hypothetical protein